MGRARVVTPPPVDYVPEPLVAPPPEVTEEVAITEWMDSNLTDLIEEIEQAEPSAEELEKERIAQERYEEIQRKKQEEAERLAKIEEDKRIALEEAEEAKRLLAEEKDRLAAIAHEQLQKKKEEETVVASREKLAKKDKKESKIAAELAAEMEELRRQNEELTRQKEAAEKAREEQILKARQQATEKRGSQLNIVQARKPSIKSRIKDFFKRRRIQLATVPRGNYEQAIIHQASVAVPKMLDDIEKMHERLTILEELLVKHKERQKIKD